MRWKRPASPRRGPSRLPGGSQPIRLHGNQAFVENYRARFGTEPTAFAAFSYASVLILAWAIEKAPSTDSVSIREALADISDLDTVLGPFSFDANGDAMYEPKVLIVNEGKLQAFE